MGRRRRKANDGPWTKECIEEEIDWRHRVEAAEANGFDVDDADEDVLDDLDTLTEEAAKHPGCSFFECEMSFTAEGTIRVWAKDQATAEQEAMNKWTWDELENDGWADVVSTRLLLKPKYTEDPAAQAKYQLRLIED